ncbi:MAG: hypothetical protein AAGC71_17540 [Pseudomonadota bacterium]
MVTAVDKVGRWHIASRVFAAVIPAFVLTNTTGVFFALASPAGQFQAIATSLASAFAIYTVIILWIFSVKRLKTVWLGLLAGLVITAGGSWLLYTFGANG